MPLDFEQLGFLALEGEKYGFAAGEGFMRIPSPPLEYLVGEWMFKGSISLLYSERGLGKTNLLLGLALACAKGEDFIGYKVSRPMTVMFVDSEMTRSEMQMRARSLNGGE